MMKITEKFSRDCRSQNEIRNAFFQDRNYRYIIAVFRKFFNVLSPQGRWAEDDQRKEYTYCPVCYTNYMRGHLLKPWTPLHCNIELFKCNDANINTANLKGHQ
jgi:hypothetical protein